MIELNEFELPRKDYLKLIFWNGFPQNFRAFAYLVVFLTALSIVADDWFYLTVFVSVFLIVFSIVHCFRYWSYSPSVKDSHFYQKRNISFDAEKFHIHTEDGSESHILLSHVPRMDRLGNYYRLFVNRISFVPIPISAFRCEEDRKRFEELFHDKMPSPKALRNQIIIFFLVSALLLGGAFGWRMLS